jgi:subtilisin-like proprotein convertase family protein
MSYAGICPPQNVQLNSDGYFHQKSLQVMFDNITSGLSQCATLTPTGNSAPTADAGTNYTIPKSTPYKLTGSSTDPDGTASHTYTWEQYDLGPTGAPTETTLLGPIVRSRPGTVSPVRYIPVLNDVVDDGGVSTAWEKLAAISRPLNFRLTVRDNVVAGGQTATDIMTATVNADAGPFRVISQDSDGISWSQGSTETISWDVAGTNSASGINASNVNILLSTDGGVNFDTVLASNVPNDGSQDITVPNVVAPFCRIMIEAVGNIFFNVNTADFAIGVTVTTTCTTYSSAENLGLPIPDGLDGSGSSPGTPRFSSIFIPDSKVISKISINADISHPSTGEILIQFQHPDVSGNNAFVNAWTGNCVGNSLDITFSDDAIPIVCGSPTIGTFSPNSSLDDKFLGLNSQGSWNMAVLDFFSGNTGTINDWSIEICSTSLSVNQNELSDSFSVFPNPNNGEFTVKFNGTSGNVDLQVFDIRGRSVFNNSYDSAGEFNQTINLGNVQSGMYLLNVNTDAGKVTKKLIVE